MDEMDRGNPSKFLSSHFLAKPGGYMYLEVWTTSSIMVIEGTQFCDMGLSGAGVTCIGDSDVCMYINILTPSVQMGKNKASWNFFNLCNSKHSCVLNVCVSDTDF